MWTFVIALLVGAGQFGQSSSGELRIIVRDSGGLAVQCRVTLVSEANDVTQQLDTGTDGLSVVKRLPFGRYHIAISHPGFASYAGSVDVDSVLPRELGITLTPAPIQAQVTVRAEDTLLDTHQTSALNRFGTDTLQQRITTLPGRSLADMVNTEPGWLLEANGILHPRGSEYQVQYVVDGLPVTDNRSPSFAPEFDADEVHSMSILTGGYPAKYGRKLGGVIEVVTAANPREGVHGSAVASVGSFATASGGVAVQYGWSRTLLGISGSGTHRPLSQSARRRELHEHRHRIERRHPVRARVLGQRSARSGHPARAIELPRAQRTRAGRGGSAAGAEQPRYDGRALVSTRPFVIGRGGGPRDGAVRRCRTLVE